MKKKTPSFYTKCERRCCCSYNLQEEKIKEHQASQVPPDQTAGVVFMSDSPHEFLHDFLHPHLQTYEADAIAPPQLEQVQQVPVSLLQYQLLSIEHSSLSCHAATILQPSDLTKYSF